MQLSATFRCICLESTGLPAKTALSAQGLLSLTWFRQSVLSVVPDLRWIPRLYCLPIVIQRSVIVFKPAFFLFNAFYIYIKN